MPFQFSYDPNRSYRCAIYARFSSDMQNRASIPDQIRECRDAATRYGWTVLDEYIRFDEATSGQSLDGREGLLELLELASQPDCPFDGILIDDTSRFGRNLSDTLPLTDKFSYRKIFLHFVTRRLDSRDPNFRSLFIKCGEEDENFSRGLAEKVHRAHRGRVLNKCAPNGQCYGYRNVGIPDPNRRQYGHSRVLAVKRDINPEEARVIVRIYEMYVSGLGYRSIADILNREGVPSPLRGSGKRPRRWCARTICKILNQPKYRGIHLWNTTKVVRNPDKGGKKEQHPRPESEWERVEIPEWEIISRELWTAKEAAASLRRAQWNILGGRNRTGVSRRYIFGGPLTCGICGDKMRIVGGTGPTAMYGCFNRRFRGKSMCSNNRMIRESSLRHHLLEALTRNLLNPDVTRTMSEEFERQLKGALEEQEKKAQQIAGDEGNLKARKAELEKQEENAVDAILNYGGSPALQARLDSLKSQIKAIDGLFATARVLPDIMPSAEVIREFLGRKLACLAEILAGDPLLARGEIDKRVTKLVLTPIQIDGRRAYEVAGDLRLFAQGDVLRDISSSKSAEHYTLAILFHTQVGIGCRQRKELPVGDEADNRNTV
jgi:site-specific DNA recombinase